LRKRRYVARRWLTLLSPALRYSYSRDAYVLKGVGRSVGPVLRQERRDGRSRPRYPAEGAERRRASVA
jgi:hypothetical protein